MEKVKNTKSAGSHKPTLIALPIETLEYVFKYGIKGYKITKITIVIV